MQSFTKCSIFRLLPLWLSCFVLLSESRGFTLQDNENYAIKFISNARETKEENDERGNLEFPDRRITHEVLIADGLYFHLPVNCSMSNDAIAFDTDKFKEVPWLKLSKDGLVAHGFIDVEKTEPTGTICIGNSSFVCACIEMHCETCPTQSASRVVSMSGTKKKAIIAAKSGDLGVTKQKAKSTKEGSTQRIAGNTLRSEGASAIENATKSATRVGRHRPRRDVADLQYQISCGSSTIVTEGVMLLNANYHNMSSQEKSQLVSQASTYTGVAKRNVLLKQNHGNFYKTELSNPSFIAFGLGDSTGQIAETTIVKFLLGCDSVPGTDSRIAKIRGDSPTGALTGLFGHKIIGWYIIAGTFVPITTTAPPSTTTAAGPQPPTVNKIPTIIISNTTFRFEFQIPANTFIDKEDGNTRNLNLYLYDSAGNVIPKASWISLQTTQQILRMYSSKAIFAAQPTGGYTYRLSAIDSSGRESHTDVRVLFNGPINSPGYLRTMLLTSTTTVVVTSFFDVDILFLLQSKMAAYLNIKATDIFTSVFTVTRSGNSMLAITYTFSTGSLAQSTCNEDAVSNLRSKMAGSAAQQAFTTALQPQFSVTSLSGESFQGPCSYLSSSPATIGVVINSLELQIGRVFSFAIPATTYLSPAGTNMRLSLQLRFANNTNLPSNYWMGLSQKYLDQNAKMEGVATWRSVSQQSSFTFKLVGLTPLLVETSQNVLFNVQKGFTTILFSVVMTQSSAITISTVSFINLFESYMSSYLGISSSSFVIIDFAVSSNTILSWTISTLSSTPCQTSEINKVKAKLLKSNGSVNDDLRAGLISKVNFTPSNIKFNTFGSCDVPRVNVQIPTLQIPRYDALNYVVPSNAFTDGKDGANLRLELLQENGSPLPANSWIWFDKDTRTISGMPYDLSSTKTFKYMLRATDSDGSSVQQTVTISLGWIAPAYNAFFHIEFNYIPSTLPLAKITTAFLRQLKAYFKQSAAQNIIIFQPTLINSKVSLYYQNTSLQADICDPASAYIMGMIGDSTQQSKPKQAFISAMQPNFTITLVEEKQKKPECLIKNKSGPTFAPINTGVYPFWISVKTVPYCDVSKYLVPAGTFLDEEDGNTRNLKLNLTSTNNKQLPISNWVTINVTSQTLYAVADDSVYSSSGGSIVNYRLVATDSGGKSDGIELKFAVSGPPPPGYYNITMALNVLQLGSQPYPLQIAPLLKSLQNMFPNGPGVQVRSYNVISKKNVGHQAVFVWSPCNMLNNRCNATAIELIRSKIFTAGTNNMKPNLNSLIDRRFQVTNVMESRGGPCKKDPPVVFTNVPTLSIKFCGPFSYKIPTNTFKDNQDGNTSKLALKLLQANGFAIPSDFWLQFDSSKQEITAVLTKVQSSSSYPRQHVFMLVATDTTSLSVNTTFKIRIDGTFPTYSHEFSLQTIYSLPSNAHLLYEFATKFRSFLGDSGQNFLAISMTKAAGNKVIITWSDCSRRYNPCDVLKIKQVRDKMQTSSGAISNAFTQAMAPTFSQLFLTEKNHGPCLVDKPPVLAAPFGPISVTTCQTFKAAIPQGTFTDNEQGNARNLDLKLKGNTNNWITFDSSKQEISIIATNQIVASLSSRSITVVLSATDASQQVAQQNLVINITPVSTSATQKITMKYRLRSLPAGGNFVSIHDAMRNDIAKYFASTNVVNSVEYATLPTSLQLNTLLTAEWSSCSLSRDTCDTNSIRTMTSMILNNGAVTQAFKTALQPNIDISTVTFSYQGRCKEQISPPVVQNPLPIFNLSFCGYQVLEIPANTFYDSLDGYTPNMTLSIWNTNGQVSNEKWMYFNQATQTITIIVSDEVLLNITPPAILRYKIKAVTKRGLSVMDDLRFSITKLHRNVSFSIKVNFAYLDTSQPNRNLILSDLMDLAATYFGGRSSDIHFSSITETKISVGTYFAVVFANCSVRYEPCDKAALLNTQNKLYDESGTLPAFKAAFGSKFQITYVQLRTFGPCNIRNTAPYVKTPLTKIQVRACSDFNYTIPANTFRDEEDANLQLSVTKINGLPVSGSYQWVGIRPGVHELVGIVTDSIISRQPTGGYKLTIRATDSAKQSAETQLIVEIVDGMPQKLYQFTMKLTSKSTMSSQFFEELNVIGLLNRYFSSRFTHVMGSIVASNTITLRSSICSLPNKCDEALASSYFNRLVTTEKSVPQALANFFASSYTVTSTSVYRNPLCLVPLNPPVPSMATWRITGSYCGGFRVTVPSDLFNDKEDGNTRNLALELYQNSKDPITSKFWVQLNKTSQEIYGFPTRKQTEEYTTSTPISLVAKDSTGQEGSVNIVFSFTQHPAPKYIYKVVFESVYSSSVDEINAFSAKMKLFLDDKSTSSFGLIRHPSVSSTTHFIEYANCSVSYNPCDIYGLTTVKNRLLTSSNLPTSEFKAAMRPFVISYGTVQLTRPCSTASTNPPIVVNRINYLNISYWSIFTFQIQTNTFYDTEDGNTRRLTLSLTNGNNQALSSNFWMQLNTKTQIITAYAYSSLALSQPSLGYSFILTATDSTSLSASNSFYARLYGPYKIFNDCQIKVKFNVDASLTSSSNNVLADRVIKSLQSYFSISSSEIGLVSFTRHSSSQFTFSWSYCSPLYRQIPMALSSQYTTVDYKGLVTKVLMSLFQSDRKTVQTSFYAAFNGLTVASVQTQFTGLCQNIPPVLTSLTSLSYNLNYCGYRKEAMQSTWFYDFEDGNTFNLKLALLTNKNETVGIESWVNMDMVTKSLLMSLRDSQRTSGQSNFVFYLKATDTGGKNEVLPINLRQLAATNTKSPFSITFEYKMKSSSLSDIYVNESIVLSDQTAQLYALTTGKNVITSQYPAQLAPVDSRSFTWLSCSYQACSSSTVLQKTRQLLQSSSGVFQTFKNKYLPSFDLLRAYYSSSCGEPGLPPAPSSTIIEFNITMCSPLTFKIPASTFIDSVDGEMPNMKVTLLDSNKKALSTSSWLQLNTATLQIYAMYQSSMLPSYTAIGHSSMISSTSMTSSSSSATSSSTAASSTPPVSQSIYFQLEATNSRGLKSYKQLKANIVDSPYTSDCYTTIAVTRKFGASSLADLDVVFKLITAISNYYNDKNTMIKVNKFQKLSTYSYSLKFSNCSFVFSTMKAARNGLTESHRAAIAAIFSRMVGSSGAAQSSFTSSLSAAGFTLQSVTVSYSCIEAPPYSPKVQKYKPYAFLCREFNDLLPADVFNDTRDGTNLLLSLRYTDGVIVSPNEWIQLDPFKKVVYGSVTNMVKQNVPSFSGGYDYLLYATDSSGRSANISYQVKIANSAPVTDVRFILGFQSIYNEYSKTADLFVNITRKLAKYLDNNNQGSDVVISSYDAFNVISWEYCKITCQPNAMRTILQKLQKEVYKPLPSDAFKAALGPEITPSYIFVNGPKCIESTIATVVVNYRITVPGQMCGFIDYTIPSNVFSNSLGESTRDLLLTLKTSTGSSLSSSSIVQFRQDLQQIQGVAVYSSLSSSMTYRLTAVSSRSTASPTSTNVQITFSQYEAFKSVEPKLCTLTANVTTNYNPAVSDVYILRKFTQKLANFFKSDSRQVQIISYTRSTSFPIRLSIKFSNCSWSSLLQSPTSSSTYYRQVQSTLSSLFRHTGTTITGVRKELEDSLKPDFYLSSIERNQTTCYEPPNKPPTSRTLAPVAVARCGEFNYQIPADLFSDEDGKTRNLKIDFLQNDGTVLPFDSWIVYDNKTQSIAGLPLNRTLAQQPSGGYKYIVKATDSAGASTLAVLTLKINGQFYASKSGQGLFLSYQSIVSSHYQMDKILAFTRKLASFSVINDPLNRFRVTGYVITPTSIVISLVNCTECNPEAVIKMYRVLTKQAELNSHMAPEFPVAVEVKPEGKCSTGDNFAGKIYNVTFCGMTSLNYLTLNGLTEGEMQPGTKFIVRNSNGQALSKSSWFWFNESSSTLEAFSSESSWKSQPVNGTKYTWTTASIATGQQSGSFQRDALRIIGTPPSSGLQYTITFATTLSSTTVDAYFISLVFKSIASYLNRQDIQHISVLRQEGDIVSFTWNFQICGLPADCRDSKVKTVDSKIFQSPNILRPEFKATFPSSINVESVRGNCKDFPPEIRKKNLNITIPVCGFYRFKIPADFATDTEDGNAYKLSISIRMSDGSLIPRDSWLQFNETSYEIYAFPTESVASTPQPSGWPYMVIVKDSGGKQVQTSLTVFLEQDKTAFYKLSMTFQTVNMDSSVPFLDIQVRFLSMISTFFYDSSLSQYRVLSFVKTGTKGPKSETFFIQFGNCSVNSHVCLKEDKSLTTTQNAMILSYRNPNSPFSQYISKIFKVTSVKNESLYTIDEPPTVLNKINDIQVDKCGHFVGPIPKATFYDPDESTCKQIVMSLTFLNGTKPSEDYWIQFRNNTLYVVPYGDTKPGTYQMRLTAKDCCGHSVSTIVTTKLTDNSPEAQYGFCMTLNTSTTTTTPGVSMPTVYYISKLKDILKAKTSDANYKTRITYFKQTGKTMEICWRNCSVTCNENLVLKVKENFLTKENDMNPEFKALAKPYFNITKITETRSENCSTLPSPTPPTQTPSSNRSLELNVSLCRKLNFTIPTDVFNDPEDGGTRNLQLSLVTESRQPVDKQSWVQLDQNSQTIYGYPRIGLSNSFQREFRYLLVARDRNGNTGSTPMTIKIIGDLPEVTYKLTMSGSTTLNENLPQTSQEIILINKIGSYFNDYAINDISYLRKGNSFEFAWSFCKMRTDKCDCYKMQQVRDKLKSFQAFQNEMSPDVMVTSQVKEELLGVCRLTQKPELRIDRNELIVEPGQYFSTVIRNDKFYDYEDGFVRNLTLYMSNSNNMRVENSNWIKLQDYKICGLLTLTEARQNGWMVTSTREYKTVARDRCEKETSDSYIVRVTKFIPDLQYKITVFLDEDIGENCTKMSVFVKKISTYLRTPESYIYIYNHTVYNATNNASMIVWGLRNITENNCRNDTTKVIREKFLLPNETVDPKFVEYMRPQYEVVNVIDEQSEGCTNATILLPPPPIKTDDDFPWWLLILFLILLLLLLLLWLLWVLCPRCCWKCCAGKCGCCQRCCSPGGKYASMKDPLLGTDPDDEEVLKLPDDEEATIMPDPDGDVIMKVPTKGPIEEDIERIQLNTESYDYPEDLKTGMLPLPLEDDGDKAADLAAEEDSSGFREEFSEGSDFDVDELAGLADEQEMEMKQADLAQTAPMDLPSTPPPQVPIPPLYSSSRLDRLASLENTSDAYGSMSDPESYDDMKPNFRPEDDIKPNFGPATTEIGDTQYDSQYTDARMTEEYNNTTDVFDTTEQRQNISMVTEATRGEFPEERRLPQPNIEFSNTRRPSQSNIIFTENQDQISQSSETRRFSDSFTDRQDFQETSFQESNTEVNEQRNLPRPSELVLPSRTVESYRRSSFDDREDFQESRDNVVYIDETRTRRRSVPLILDEPITDYAITDDSVVSPSRWNSLRASRRRSLSEANIVDYFRPQTQEVILPERPMSSSRRRSVTYVDGGPDSRISRRRSVSYDTNDGESVNSRRRSVSYVTSDGEGIGSRRRSVAYVTSDGRDQDVMGGRRRSVSYVASDGEGTGGRRRSREYFSSDREDIGDGGRRWLTGSRRISSVNSFGGSSSSRRGSTQQLIVTGGTDSQYNDTSDSLEQPPLKVRLGNEDAYGFSRRSSFSNDRRNSGSGQDIGRRISRTSLQSGYYGESDSGISDFGMGSRMNLSQEDLVSTDYISRRPSRSTGRSRRSSSKPPSTKLNRGTRRPSQRYELQSRRVSRAFVNDAYVSDSNV